MLKANEASAGKYWIVNSSDGPKVGTLRAVDAGYEFDSRTNTTSTFDTMDESKYLNGEKLKRIMPQYKVTSNWSIWILAGL